MPTLDESIKLGQWRVYLISAAAIILWGLSYIWSDELIKQAIPVEYFVFIRVVIAAIILFLINLVWGEDMHIRRKDLPKFLLLSLCEPFVYFICETYGIFLTESPTYSALIIASTPIFSLLVGTLFLREKLTLINVLGLFISVLGLVFVTFQASSVGRYFVLGAILLFVAVLAEVGHASCTKLLSDNYRPLVITMYQFSFGAVFLLPLFIFKGLRDFDMYYLSWQVIGPIVSLAVFCSAMAFSLWVSTIKSLGVAKSSIFLAMIPIVTAVAGVITGVEILSHTQWIGIGVCCAGVILSQWCKEKEGKCRK